MGETLTADISGIDDADGLPAESEFDYQWIRNDGSTDANIAGATYSTYVTAGRRRGQVHQSAGDLHRQERLHGDADQRGDLYRSHAAHGRVPGRAGTNTWERAFSPSTSPSANPSPSATSHCGTTPWT